MMIGKLWFVFAALLQTTVSLAAQPSALPDDDRIGRWECYQGAGDDCKKVFVPANATVDSYGYWSCDRGYQLNEDHCVDVVVPANATASKHSGTWTCNKGFLEIDGKCIAECKRNPSTCLRTFVKKGDFASASYLYNQNHDLFQSDKEAKRRKKELIALADRLNEDFSVRQQKLTNELLSSKFDSIDPATWAAVRATISAADALVAEYNSHKILSSQDNRSPESIELETQLESLTGHIVNQRQSAFLAYDHSGPLWFFKSYPVKATDRPSFVRSNWRKLWPIIDSMAIEDLFAVIEAWTLGSPGDLQGQIGTEISTAFADTYFRRTIEDISVWGDNDLTDFLDAISKANDIGLVPSEAISSRLLLVISEPLGGLSLNFDLHQFSPMQVVREVPDDVLSDSYDMVILLGITNAELQEKTAETRTVASTYEAGLETVVNPAYLTAQSKYNLALDAYSLAQSNSSIAQANLRNCQARTTWCIAESWQAGATSGRLGEAGEALRSAQRALENTTPSVTKPVVEDYRISVSSIELRKSVSGTAVVLTAGNQKPAQIGDFLINESTSIDIALNSHPKDYGAKRRYRMPDDLKAKESAKFQVNVFNVLSELSTEPTKIGSVKSLRKLTAAAPARDQRSSAPVANTASFGRVTDVRASHSAIDSVVVVQTPLGSRGAGFYVTDSLLLTNYHVVAESDFVEIIQFDGSRSTGQVRATDIDRDLALVETSSAGPPLKLFSGNVLPLGESVIAIGHPSGLNFSLTKGIISAVREHPTTTGAIGKQFLFVQTDAAIGPGNSGGPLMLDNEVIGINTQKLVDMQIEGIGFALHYAEIARFLATSAMQ